MSQVQRLKTVCLFPKAYYVKEIVIFPWRNSIGCFGSVVHGLQLGGILWIRNIKKALTEWNRMENKEMFLVPIRKRHDM